MRPSLLLAPALLLLTGCTGLDPDFSPPAHASDQDFVVSLQRHDADHFQLVLWYKGYLRPEQGNGFRVEMQDDRLFAATTTVNSGQRADYSTWNFDRARWEQHRPFRILVSIGQAPMVPEHKAWLEVDLGRETGQGEGLRVRVLRRV